MTTTNAIRFLHFEAAKCRDRDSSEALCLLLPSLLRLLDLEPMEDVEAAAFRFEFKQRLAGIPFRDATDRQDQARPVSLARRVLPEPCSESEGSDVAGARCEARQSPASSFKPAVATP
jgi:hypothetical protein